MKFTTHDLYLEGTFHGVKRIPVTTGPIVPGDLVTAGWAHSPTYHGLPKVMIPFGVVIAVADERSTFKVMWTAGSDPYETPESVYSRWTMVKLGVSP